MNIALGVKILWPVYLEGKNSIKCFSVIHFMVDPISGTKQQTTEK